MRWLTTSREEQAQKALIISVIKRENFGTVSGMHLISVSATHCFDKMLTTSIAIRMASTAHQTAEKYQKHFDAPDVLEKINKLAKWIRGSKHFQYEKRKNYFVLFGVILDYIFCPKALFFARITKK